MAIRLNYYKIDAILFFAENDELSINFNEHSQKLIDISRSY